MEDYRPTLTMSGVNAFPENVSSNPGHNKKGSNHVHIETVNPWLADSEDSRHGFYNAFQSNVTFDNRLPPPDNCELLYPPSVGCNTEIFKDEGANAPYTGCKYDAFPFGTSSPVAMNTWGASTEMTYPSFGSPFPQPRSELNREIDDEELE